MVKIRLKRMGKKAQPTYRVVVADARAPRDGRVLDSIGRYDPRTSPSTLEIDPERALAWLRRGARPTEPVIKLMEIAGVLQRFRSERPASASRART